LDRAPAQGDGDGEWVSSDEAVAFVIRVANFTKSVRPLKQLRVGASVRVGNESPVSRDHILKMPRWMGSTCIHPIRCVYVKVMRTATIAAGPFDVCPTRLLLASALLNMLV
jgi:hypothetical protein